jgi:hypothetical protein
LQRRSRRPLATIFRSTRFTMFRSSASTSTNASS